MYGVGAIGAIAHGPFLCARFWPSAKPPLRAGNLIAAGRQRCHAVKPFLAEGRNLLVAHHTTRLNRN